MWARCPQCSRVRLVGRRAGDEHIRQNTHDAASTASFLSVVRHCHGRSQTFPELDRRLPRTVALRRSASTCTSLLISPRMDRRTVEVEGAAPATELRRADTAHHIQPPDSGARHGKQR